MYAFKASNGYELSPSDDLLHGIFIDRNGHGYLNSGLNYGYLEVLWQYFENPEVCVADGSVEPWERSIFRTFDDKELLTGVTLRTMSQVTPGKQIEQDVDDEIVDAFRELYVWLDGAPASSLWTHRASAVAHAILAVGNTPEQVEAIWADQTQRALWTERAKAALTHVDQYLR